MKLQCYSLTVVCGYYLYDYTARWWYNNSVASCVPAADRHDVSGQCSGHSSSTGDVLLGNGG